MPPQAPPPGPPRPPGPGRPPGPYQGPYPGGPPRPGAAPPPPPRPPVQSIYGPGGPTRAPAAPPPSRPSRAALVALVLAVLVAPVGFVLGIVARRRIDASVRPVFDTPFEESRERLTGRPLATAAIVVGLLVTLGGGALVAALTVGVPTSWLGSSDVPVAKVQSLIEEATRLPAGSVRCPGALPATVGATVTCTGVSNGQPVNLRATVRTVDGGVRLDVVRV
jgi:hypothetical protein